MPSLFSSDRSNGTTPTQELTVITSRMLRRLWTLSPASTSLTTTSVPSYRRNRNRQVKAHNSIIRFKWAISGRHFISQIEFFNSYILIWQNNLNTDWKMLSSSKTNPKGYFLRAPESAVFHCVSLTTTFRHPTESMKRYFTFVHFSLTWGDVQMTNSPLAGLLILFSTLWFKLCCLERL